MEYLYVSNPQLIEQTSFAHIRELLTLDHLSVDAQQVVMRVVHSLGDPQVAQHMRLTTGACAAGRQALGANQTLLCDAEMVKQGLTKRMLTSQPQCFINHPLAHTQAVKTGVTRSMAALSLWTEQLADSIVVIGNAPTALFRLLEMLHQGYPKPALIVGIPVGFVGAAESKQALWQAAEQLDVECITLLGRQGGSAAAAAVINALLRCNLGEYY